MAVISEKWSVTVDKREFILTGEEINFILNNQQMRFIKLKGLIVNPAYIHSMVLVERKNDLRLESGESSELSDAQKQKNLARIERLKELIAKREAVSK